MALRYLDVLATFAIFSLLLTFLFQYCVVILLSKRTLPPSSSLPGITVLKPLKDVDSRLLDNLRSLGHQDYPSFEIIFGCQDPCDPACLVVEQFIREFPQVHVKTRFGHPPLGLNPKVANLAHMAKIAQYDILLVSDASVCLRPDALAILVSDLADHVGLVCNIVVGMGPRSLGALIDCLQMNAFVATTIAGSRVLGKHSIVMGKSMLMRRTALLAAGGWDSVRDVLAEDYVLGRRIEAAGFAVAFSPMPIHSFDPERTFAECVARHIRWAQMRRNLSPMWFWLEILLNPTPWSLAVLIVSILQNRPVFCWLALSASMFKIAADACLHHFLTGEHIKLFAILCVIPKDCIMTYTWLMGMFRREIMWRGHFAYIGAGSTLTLPANMRATGIK